MHIIETTIADKIEQAATLLGEHWHESARNKHLMVLKPDLAQYQALEAAGVLVGLVAYDGDAMVGYSVNIITPHLHYADLMCAHNDVLFVASKYRDTPLGLKLIRETERACKARGARLMLWHAKEDTNLSKILPRIGCRVQEIIYTKEL
ncbi:MULTISPECIES: GNAT family N-acetyltransferase [unclassified Janthinobacterium]|uniref:GNAT family N-acetyltransferase n=1 Tax=unclassified Janthinobacterium TaxID=2610881 RepID=UPI00034B06EE|nr:MULTISPECIES: GNAT family N-acetyltransferase [unclassified Janthinobacterium]MEC5161710.1 GNAT superfamily N-acetyltransferase [Janthinobacterium sp. CG_S6]